MSDINQLITDMDELMDRILEDPTLAKPEEIDLIIKHHRQYRAKIEGGEKPKKAKSTVSLDLAQLGLVPQKEPIKRRI